MKKLMYLALSLALVFSLAACGEEQKDEPAPADDKQNEESADDAEKSDEQATEEDATDEQATEEDASEEDATEDDAANEEATEDEASEEDTAAPGEAGFTEIPIGETVEGIYEVAGVYFQPVDMYPPNLNPSKEDSDMHMEADIHLTKEGAELYGFGEDEGIWPAYLNVKYVVTDAEGNEVTTGNFMPMNASDGPHYGANIKKDVIAVGTYKLKFIIKPDENGYLLHTDADTGVNAQADAKNYFEPVEVEFDWDYTGEQMQDE